MFLQTCWGVLNQPYVTMRRLAQEGKIHEVIGIFAGSIIFFLFVTPLRADSFHPLLLTYNFGLLTSGFLFTFFLVVASFYLVGRLLGGAVALRSIVILWAYSLLPTLMWFAVTSALFVMLPPPRTVSVMGRLFSIVFTAFCLGLFFWKGILYYLTLRFGLRFDLGRIFLASIILFPLGIVYAVVMYRLGIFRVPFI